MNASDFLFLPGGEIGEFALLRGEVWPCFDGHLMAQGGTVMVFVCSTLLVVCFYICFRLLYCVYRSCFRGLDYTSRDLVICSRDRYQRICSFTSFLTLLSLSLSLFAHAN